MNYLLDTDWAIQALAGRAQAVNPLLALSPQGIAISWITVGELYEGAYGFANPLPHLEAVRELIKPLYLLGLDDPIMNRFAQLRGTLRRQGQLIPDFDLLLAATSVAHHLTILTFNVRHFTRIPEVRVYQQQSTS